MTQMFIQELQITATTVGSAFKSAVKKWNVEHPDQLETYKSVLINALAYWNVVQWLELKESDLADELRIVCTEGTRGWNDMNEVELMYEFMTEGLGRQCVDEGLSLPEMFEEYPWLILEGN